MLSGAKPLRALRLLPWAAAVPAVPADAGAVHGFDGTDPVRLRSDMPNGVAKSGVHVGGDPAARAASQRALDDFLWKNLQ